MLRLTSRITLFGLLAITIGCENSTPEVSDIESEFAELANIESESLDLVSVSHSESDGPGTATSQLQLSRGDQYQFVRTIEQTMTQQSRGSRRQSSSSLSLHVTLKVEEVEADRILLTAQYSDINYSHDIGGQRVQFTEYTPPTALPIELQPYRGLADNEFSFWLGRNNQVESVVTFPEFLSRCLRYVPAGQQQVMIQRMSAMSPEDAVSTFVDETIGLLPFGAAAESMNVGDSWNRDRQIRSPLPMYLSSTCSMKELSHTSATVSITGKIAAPNGSGPLRQGVQLLLRDGQTLGRCQFDRSTGLPLDCRIERSLDLNAALNDGTEVRQLKNIVTTFTAHNRAPVAQIGSDFSDTIQQTAMESQSVSNPSAGNTARYPDEGIQQAGFGQ